MGERSASRWAGVNAVAGSHRSASDVVWREHGSGGAAFVEARHPRMLVGPAWPGVLDVSSVRSVEGLQVEVVTGYRRACQLLTGALWGRAVAARRELVGPASAMSVTEMDPPRHTWLRGLIGKAFAPRAVERLRPGIQRQATDLLAKLRIGGPHSDFLSQFCAPFAFAVHCDLLGVPEPARPVLYEWSLARSARPDATAAQVHAAEVGLHDAVVEVLAHQRERGAAPGLFASLLAVREQGGLTETELTGLAASLFFDGHILASTQIANAMLCLLLHPDQLNQVRADPSLIPAAAEEVLRWSPSITLGMTRTTSIPVGQAAGVAFGLTNRDPAIFDEPDRFIVTRQPNRHLSFGRGVHHCLGAHLMRTELHVALNTVLRELPDVRLAVAERTLSWSASLTVRSLNSLPLHWTR